MKGKNQLMSYEHLRVQVFPVQCAEQLSKLSVLSWWLDQLSQV